MQKMDNLSLRWSLVIVNSYWVLLLAMQYLTLVIPKVKK